MVKHTMNTSELIPQHKNDHERVNILKTLELIEIKPILPDLLVWLQDANWPIAQGVEDIVINFQDELIPYVRDIFQTNDGTWKYFLLHGLIKRLPDSVLILLKSDLERMKNTPTPDEEYEELEDILTELLLRI
ncbi:hypothetical protein J2T14_002187 [Paenibacillus harenae]|nr:hypothetical protein [Paenibacillus harenae]